MKKRKFMAICLSALLLMSAFSGSASAFTEIEVPAITLSSEKACPGDTVDMKVMLVGNRGFISMSLDIVYDETALKLVNVTDSGLLSGQMHSDRLESPYALVWENDTARENFTVNGLLATLTFEILAESKGEYAVTCSIPKDGIYDTNGEDVMFSMRNGKITVGLDGDIDGNGQVNAFDAIALIRYIAEPVGDGEGYDLNGDGRIDVLDVLALISLI